jgi:hypothetical protein
MQLPIAKAPLPEFAGTFPVLEAVSTQYAKLVWKDPEGHYHDHIFEQKLLKGNATKLYRVLLSRGAHVPLSVVVKILVASACMNCVGFIRGAAPRTPRPPSWATR